MNIGQSKLTIDLYKDKKICLIPNEYFKKDKRKYYIAAMALLIVLVFYLIFDHTMGLIIDKSYYENEVTRYQVLIEEKKNLQMKQLLLEKLNFTIDDKEKLVMKIDWGNRSILEMVNYMDTVLGKEIKYLSLSANSEENFTIVGRATSTEAVANFIHELKSIRFSLDEIGVSDMKYFDVVFVPNITTMETDDEDEYDFSITCEFTVLEKLLEKDGEN